MVDDFGPPDFLPVGAVVNLPVTVRAYARKGGSAAYGITINRPAIRGTAF